MHRVLLLGAGKIGRMIARLLVDTGDYDVLVGDSSPEALELIARRIGVKTVEVNVESESNLASALAGRDTVISALSYYHNPRVAEAALAAGASYFDLTEDVETTRRVRAVAAKGRCVLVSLHDLTLAARWCDRVVVLDGGRVAADGEPGAVLDADLLRSVYGVTAHVAHEAGKLVVAPLALSDGRRP